MSRLDSINSRSVASGTAVAKVLATVVVCYCAVRVLSATMHTTEFATIVHLPEPPKNILEVAAVSTVVLIAWWRHHAKVTQNRSGSPQA